MKAGSTSEQTENEKQKPQEQLITFHVENGC